MRKDTITLNLGDEESMHIEAYLSSVDGLAIHRQVVYLPGKEEHKFSSKWQITHIKSGRGLLRPSECTETMAAAESVAKQLHEFDWTRDRVSVMAMDGVREALDAALSGAEIPERVTGSRRYLVRRNKEGPGYVVWDDDTEKVVETFVHRGMASQKASELNATVST